MNISRLGLNTVSIKFNSLEEMASAAAGAGFRTIECPLDQIRKELAKGLTPAQARAIINGHKLTVSGASTRILSASAPRPKSRRARTSTWPTPS